MVKKKNCPKQNASTSSLSSEEHSYKFTLIQFTQSHEQGIFDVDIVPTTWIWWDRSTETCQIKYPSPPYTASTCKTLQSLVKNEKSALTDWPDWTVTVHGGADTYNIALSRFQKLRTAKYAYTTDTEMNQRQKALRSEKNLKKKSLKDLLAVPTMDDVDKNLDPEVSSYEVSSSSSASPSTVKSQGRKLTIRNKVITTKRCENRFRGDLVDDFSPGPSSNILLKNQAQTIKDLQTASLSRIQSLPSKVVPTVQVLTKKDDGGSLINCSSPTVESICLAEIPNTERDVGAPRTEVNTTIDPKGKNVLRVHSFESVDGNNNASFEEQRPFPSITDSMQSLTVDNLDELGIEKSKQYSAEPMSILTAIKRLSLDVRNNIAAINGLRDDLRHSNVITTKTTVVSLQKKFELALPFSSRKNFKEFDQKLAQQKDFAQQFVESVRNLLDRGNNVSRSTNAILRRFFTRELITTFTAVKKLPGKAILKDTSFCVHLLEAVTAFHTQKDGTPIQDHEVMKLVGAAISNAKDWDGRQKRQVTEI